MKTRRHAAGVRLCAFGLFSFTGKQKPAGRLVWGDENMKQKDYQCWESYMLSCMGDTAHDREHIYRVLYQAMELAKGEAGVDYEVLTAACLLHDIGRKEQYEDPSVCHAAAGARKAYVFLTENGYDVGFAGKVADCIRTHRYRKDAPPESLEAKLLFDADKLDAAGAIGAARTLLYHGKENEPLYSMTEDGKVSDGTKDTEPSFFREYKYKLEKLYGQFFTEKGRELAQTRRDVSRRFYESLLAEAREAYRGREVLKELLDGQDPE